MRTIPEIKELFEWLETDYYGASKALQNTDWEYYKDTFKVPSIKSPYRIVRLGLGTEIVDVPVSHIVTNQPQVYVEATADNAVALERAGKRGAYLNHLVDYLIFQSPQPFKETVKNQLGRGEAWIHLAYNPDWKEGLWANDIPVTFAVPDPLVIFASPDERNGVPDYCFVSYKMHYRAVQNRYEHWKNPKNKKGKGAKALVDWFAYFDKDFIYFDADKEPVSPMTEDEDWDGRIKNLAGFTPFVHCYSGYGKSSPEGNPEELAVPRIRPVKDRILTYTEVASSAVSQLELYAHGNIEIQPIAPEYTIDPNFKYSLGAGGQTILDYGVVVKKDRGLPPSPEVFGFMQMLRYEITRSTPPLMSGMGTGSSGRAEDIETKHALSQYECIVDNASTAWATALSMSLHLVKNKEFQLLPLTLRASVPEKGIRKDITLKEEDIDDFRCVVRLKASDPIEDKAQAQIGNGMQAQTVIDWETNLTKYHGYSLDEAQKIKVKTMAEQFIKSNPAIVTAMGMAAMEKLGIEVPPTTQGGIPQTGGIPNTPGPRGGEPRKGNIKSIDALAKDADMLLANRPPRNSPGLA